MGEAPRVDVRRVRRPEVPQMIFVVCNSRGNHMQRCAFAHCASAAWSSCSASYATSFRRRVDPMGADVQSAELVGQRELAIDQAGIEGKGRSKIKQLRADPTEGDPASPVNRLDRRKPTASTSQTSSTSPCDSVSVVVPASRLLWDDLGSPRDQELVDLGTVVHTVDATNPASAGMPQRTARSMLSLRRCSTGRAARSVGYRPR